MRQSFAILALDVRSQAERRIVRNLDRFLVAAIWNYREDRAEYFFSGNSHSIVDIGKDGRLDEIAALDIFRFARTTTNQRCALINAGLNV